MDKEKQKQILLAIDKVNKQFGKGSLITLNEKINSQDHELISTGAISVDFALGGGLPKGRVVEVYGPESSGKTTFSMSIIKETQKNNGVAAFIDVEHAFDPEYAKKVGIDLESLYMAQPNCGEDALNIVESLASSGVFDLIIVDSVAALVPRSEIEGDVGDSFMGVHARMMSQALRKIVPKISNTNCLVLFINQIREKIGVTFGSNETTPGGRALKFCSSVRMEIRRITTLKKGDTDYGIRSRVKIVKNKVASPFKIGEVDIIFGEGISSESSLIDAALTYKVLEQKGSWFSYKSENIAQGKDTLRCLLKSNSQLFNEIKQSIIEETIKL